MRANGFHTLDPVKEICANPLCRKSLYVEGDLVHAWKCGGKFYCSEFCADNDDENGDDAPHAHQ